jgi:microcystin-dependent protein
MTVSVFFEDVELTSEVTMFSGPLSEVPAGWVVCDGNNGTPDLTSRFVKGDPNPASSSYATGGQNSYTLSEGQLPSHSHSGSTDQHSSSHSHTWNYGANGEEYGYYENSNHGSAVGGTYFNHHVYSSNSGNHNHSFDMNEAGGTSSVDNRPAFYEVAFIMKS